MARIYDLVPRAVGPFQGYDIVTRAVFGLILERYKISQYKFAGDPTGRAWYDPEREEIYWIYTQEQLAEEVGCSVRTVQRATNRLREDGLLGVRKADFKGACRYSIPSAVYVLFKPQRKTDDAGSQ